MKDKNNFNFGLRVKGLIVERNITTAQFLKATDTPNQRFYDWCNKGAVPNVLTAMKVARFFNMTVEQLINGADTNPLAEVVDSLQKKLTDIRAICG